MAEYRKSEAREWAKAKMRGVANVITPTLVTAVREGGQDVTLDWAIEFGI